MTRSNNPSEPWTRRLSFTERCAMREHIKDVQEQNPDVEYEMFKRCPPALRRAGRSVAMRPQHAAYG